MGLCKTRADVPGAWETDAQALREVTAWAEARDGGPSPQLSLRGLEETRSAMCDPPERLQIPLLLTVLPPRRDGLLKCLLAE